MKQCKVSNGVLFLLKGPEFVAISPASKIYRVDVVFYAVSEIPDHI